MAEMIRGRPQANASSAEGRAAKPRDKTSARVTITT